MSLLDTASLIVTPNGYKEGKLYSVIPSDGSGDMSVTRATTATRVNSAGLVESIGNNVPRLDYSNGTCPSLLVEPQRTNLLTYSSSFDNAIWGKLNSTITANAITSPDGNTTADKFVENNGTGQKWLYYEPAIVVGTSYTYSVYAKKGERNFLYINAYSGANNITWFNLNTGTIGTSQSGTPKIEDAGNGWYRCSVTITGASGTQFYLLGVSNADNTTDYSGNGTSGIYVWGAQLEQGSYPTSYIPTTSASVTRNADVISKTGISSLIGQTEGTMFVEAIVLAHQDNNTILSVNDGSLSEYMVISGNASGEVNAFILDSGNVSSVISGTYAVGTTLKCALAYKTNDVAYYINGVQIGVDTSVTIPTTSQVNIGSLNFLTAQLQGNIKAAALWKTRLTNTQLAQLTSI